MDYLAIEELMDRVGSRYSLVVGAAKRARQLKEGAVPLIKCDSQHPLTIALYEIAAGKVIIKEPGEPGDEPAIEVPEAEPEPGEAAELDLPEDEQVDEDGDDAQIEDEEG